MSSRNVVGRLGAALVVLGTAMWLPSLSVLAGPAQPADRSISKHMTSTQTLSTTTRLADKRYVAAGDHAYVIGTEDGSFPPMGWHSTGQMGGVWAHPIKLLDGYWFQVNNHWLTDATRFTSGPGYVEMQFPETGGIQVTRTEFSPDGMPVVLVKLDFNNTTGAQKQLVLSAAVRSELMAAYPWGTSGPTNAAGFNGYDTGGYDTKSGTLTFKEPGKPWYAMVRSSFRPASGVTGGSFWGPVSGADQLLYDEYGKGTGGRMEWLLHAAPHASTVLWLAVSGSHTSRGEAESALGLALAAPGKLLSEKIVGRLALLDRTRISVPDTNLEQAFQWAKMNMADLRRTVTDMKVRLTAEGSQYPPPVKTLKSVSGIGAGFPDYPWFFGADGAYTTYALLASGQWTTAIDHLRALRDISEAVNGKTGKVVHEVVTDGSVFFGLNSDAGDTNETAQFAVAVDLMWRWTGDRAFLDEMYPFIREGIRYLSSKDIDPDQDGWPEGRGMVERPDMASSTLDVASYTWLAMKSLVSMAQVEGDTTTHAWATRRLGWMTANFEKDWWVVGDSLYADSLCSQTDVLYSNAGCARIGQKVQQKYWTDATPMEVGIA
ncbi:MAG TPA: glycogen debranching protein, partial [Chloroflexota bacterium]|nr:glycogen debranching protein [Chloroflexota bacterium]